MEGNHTRKVNKSANTTGRIRSALSEEGARSRRTLMTQKDRLLCGAIGKWKAFFEQIKVTSDSADSEAVYSNPGRFYSTKLRQER